MEQTNNRDHDHVRVLTREVVEALVDRDESFTAADVAEQLRESHPDLTVPEHIVLKTVEYIFSDGDMQGYTRFVLPEEGDPFLYQPGERIDERWSMMLAMPEKMETVSDVIQVVQALDDARTWEYQLTREIAIKQADLERQKAPVIKAAYEAGFIDKKNKDTRAAGEAAAVAEDAACFELQKEIEELEVERDDAKLARMAWEDARDMLRAFMYSMARV